MTPPRGASAESNHTVMPALEGPKNLNVVTAVLAVFPSSSPATPVASATDATPTEAAFLEGHWRRPLAPHGAPSTVLPSLESAVHPAANGSCRVTQFTYWKKGLYSQGMGPSVAGLLLGSVKEGPFTVRVGWPCHASLFDR